MSVKREIRIQSNVEVIHSFIGDDCTTIHSTFILAINILMADISLVLVMLHTNPIL